MKKVVFLLIYSFAFLISAGQYNQDFVEGYTFYFNEKKCSYVKMKIDKNSIKAKYFLSDSIGNKINNVYQEFSNWTKGKGLITCFSANYISGCADFEPPIGLCIYEGKLINNVTSSSMDALVFINKEGRIWVQNIKSDVFYVTDDNGKARSINILNAFDKEYFIKWCSQNKTSIFQTHLLANKNELLVYPNANSRSSDRRFLIIALDSTTNTKYNIIFNCELGTLYESALFAYNYFSKNKDLKISTMINLDRGCNDVFKNYTKEGRIASTNSNEGNTPLDKATNLIVYYFDNSDFGLIQ